jgi:hypothetical protein
MVHSFTGSFYLMIYSRIVFADYQVSDYISSESVSQNGIIVASDKTCQIQVPPDWMILKNLGEEAIIQAGNPVTEVYCIVIPFSKEYLETDYQTFYESVIDYFQSEDFSDFFIVEADSSSKYNFRSAKAYSTEDEMHIVYFINTAETEQNYYQIVFWTVLSNEINKQPVFKDILNSFSEI